MAAELDIEVPRNGDYFQEWELADSDGVATDITGHVLELDIRALAGGPPLASADIEQVSTTRFSVHINGPDLSGLDGETEIVRLAYGLRHTFPDGIVEVPVRGHVILTPEV